MSVTPSVHDGGMTDRPLGASTTGAPPNGGGIAGDGRCYDYEEMCDGFRCRSSESLHVLRLEALAEQRWWHLRELAITAVLDERGQIDDTTAGKDGTTTRGTDPATQLAAGDGLIILGHREALPQLTRRAKSAAQVTYRGATVAG